MSSENQAVRDGQILSCIFLIFHEENSDEKFVRFSGNS